MDSFAAPKKKKTTGNILHTDLKSILHEVGTNYAFECGNLLLTKVWVRKSETKF